MQNFSDWGALLPAFLLGAPLLWGVTQMWSSPKNGTNARAQAPGERGPTPSSQRFAAQPSVKAVS